ncbi:MAG: hypothetical protein K2N56_00970 [Oscillospiraceae bacterium]|nr:hypothetical protein [Oscillospiraceae bacterium]
MEKFRRLAKPIMIVLAVLVCLFDLISLIIWGSKENGSSADSMMALCVISVICGICNFALALANAGLTYVCKADLKSAVIIGVPAIGGFVTALIMTNFTNEMSFAMYLLKNLTNYEASVIAPLVLSMIFAAAVIVTAILAVKAENGGSLSSLIPNKQMFGQQSPNQPMQGQSYQNQQVPTPSNDNNNNNNNLR